MKKVIHRTLTGILLATVTLGAVFNAYVFTGFCLFLLGAGLFEFSKLLRINALWAYFLSGAIFLPVFIFTFFKSINISFFLMLTVLIFVLFFAQKITAQKTNISVEIGHYFFIVIYVTLPIALYFHMPFIFQQYEPKSILSIFILLWVNDSTAYLFGKFFGRKKLLPRISPNKTIFGFVAGSVFATFVGALLPFFWDKVTTVDGVFLGVIVSFLGPIGDLFISMFKRQYNIKDTGRIIWGHGGLLDRFDSFFMVVPLFYLYLKKFIV